MMRDESAEKRGTEDASIPRWQVLGWVMTGALLAVLIAVVFLAYGQPALLLEQLNLRYCG